MGFGSRNADHAYDESIHVSLLRDTWSIDWQSKAPPLKAKLNVDLHRSQIGEIASFASSVPVFDSADELRTTSFGGRKLEASAKGRASVSFKTVLNKCSQRESLDGFY